MKNGITQVLRTIAAVILSLLILVPPTGSNVAKAAAVTDWTAPTAPKYLKAASITSNSVKLTWSKSTDNVGVKSYVVYRNSSYFKSSTTTGCTLTGLTPNTTYTFYIKAQDWAGNFSYASNKMTVKTLPAKIGKIIAGYYASWAAYSGYTPNDIQVSNLTHINYAFANIGANNKIMMGDPEVDPKNFAELRALKKANPNLRTLISVGGWTWSGRFSDAAATYYRRTAFADSVVAFIKQHGFDGVDLDWEYPVGGGLKSNAVRPQDKHNFTLLLKNIRQKLDAQGRLDGKRYLLTIAGGADTNYCKNVELSTIHQYLDFALIMTYDMHGSADPYTDQNSPLYKTTAYSPQNVWSTDQGVKAWLANGFPKTKLIMGVPFYGHMYTGVRGGGKGLYKPFAKMKSIDYDDIVSKYLSDPSYTRYYGATSKTPWLFNGSTFITYEDPTSLATKAAYIKANGLAGAGIWEVSESRTGTLLRTLYTKLK